MAIDTVNEKFALLGQHLPISADGLDQADNQQLLWGYPGILWAEQALVDIVNISIGIALSLPGVGVAIETPGVGIALATPSIGVEVT